MKKLLLLAALALPMSPALADAPKPDALVADGLPPVPDELPAETRPYMEFRHGRLCWLAPLRSVNAGRDPFCEHGTAAPRCWTDDGP